MVDEFDQPLYRENVNEALSSVTFTLSGVPDEYQIGKVTPHPDYLVPSLGQKEDGADLAIVELTESVDPSIARYEIYRDDEEVGQIFTRVGFGFSGTGVDGMTIPSGTKRAGHNKFDADASALNDNLDDLDVGDGFGTHPNAWSEGVYLVSDFD
ncbi:hypothetical protein OAS39_12300, partial [Pirellulales bacterium]|nr:hypothetical protein [Pirellulales bacterium]